MFNSQAVFTVGSTMYNSQALFTAGSTMYNLQAQITVGSTRSNGGHDCWKRGSDVRICL